MQIIVLGMHRSGTSAVARLLNMMGAYFGPAEQILPPSDFNLKGYWERKDVVAANEGILQSLNSNWSEIANFDIKQLDEIRLKKHVDTLAPIIRELDTHRPWMIKDPRLCLSLPVWQPLLEMPVYILVYRHPVHIARSLKKREDTLVVTHQSYPLSMLQDAAFQDELELPFSYALGLWEKYLLNALHALRGATDAPKILISYHTLLNDPVATVGNLYTRLLEHGVTGLRRPADKEIQAYLKPELCHSQSRGDDADRLTPPQAALVRACEEETIFDLQTLPTLSVGSREALAAYRQSLTAARKIVEKHAIHEKQKAESERQWAEYQAQQEVQQQVQQQAQQAELENVRQTLQQVSAEATELRTALPVVQAEKAALENAIHANWEKYRSDMRKALDLVSRKELELMEADAHLQAKADHVAELEAEVQRVVAEKQQAVEEAFARSSAEQDRLTADYERVIADKEQYASELKQAIDAKQEHFAHYERHHSAIVQQARGLIHGLESDIEAVFKSMTWRIGNVFTAVILALTLRKPGRTAQDHIAEVRHRLAGLWQQYEDSAREQKQLVQTPLPDMATAASVALAGGRPAFAAKPGDPVNTLGPKPGLFSTPDYAAWVKKYDTPDTRTLKHMQQMVAGWSNPPLISVVMPTYNTDADYLRAAIASMRAQVYPHWELCIADDASTLPQVREILESQAAEDPRIKLCFRTDNGHISAATNSALELAGGEFTAFMDHDDKLAATALFWVAYELITHPDTMLVYSDEDKIDAEETRHDPHFKPDWSPDLLLSYNYLNHLSVYRGRLIQTVGGLREGYEGAQDYDLALRVLEHLEADQIRHIPRVLYHWRATENSTAGTETQKPYALRAAQQALEEHFERLGVAVTVSDAPELTGANRVSYVLPAEPPLVSIIIPTHNGLKLLQTCIDSIVSKTDYPNYEILIVDNNSDDPGVLLYLDELEARGQARIVKYPLPFNYSAINNMAVEHAHGELLCLLNNDIEVISPDWLSEMAGHALQPHVGAVGARLWYDNETLQHGGVIVGLGGVAGHSHKYFRRGDPGYVGRTVVTQNFTAVTAACMVLRKEVYLATGGMDTEHLQVAFNDVDFCLKIHELGLYNVWTPHAELYHHESVSRGHDDTAEKVKRFQRECAYMKSRWGDVLANDPAYSPNLTLDTENFAYAWPPRVPSVFAAPGGTAARRGLFQALSAIKPQQALQSAPPSLPAFGKQIARHIVSRLRGSDSLPAHLKQRQPGYELLHGHGMEVGAFNQPALLPEDCTVEYCDVASREEVARQFAEIDAGTLVAVNHVCDLDKDELPFTKETLDFAILNHVLEHVANPILVLEKVFAAVKPGGHVVLSIPDKQFTFDKPRHLTPFEHLWEEYTTGVTEVTDEHYLDFLRAAHPGVLNQAPDSVAQVLGDCRDRREHAHVWDSASFAAFLPQALDALKISAEPVFVSTGEENQFEYFAVWQKSPVDKEV